MRNTRYTFTWACALFCFLFTRNVLSQTIPTQGHARAHDLVGVTVADRPSPYCRIGSQHQVTVDGQGSYRMYIGFPRKPGGSSGRASARDGTIPYMLDGNAAIDSLSVSDLARLSRRNAPVL